MTLTALRF